MANIDSIKEVAALSGGSLELRLKDPKQSSLVVARDRVREFKTRLGY